MAYAIHRDNATVRHRPDDHVYREASPVSIRNQKQLKDSKS